MANILVIDDEEAVRRLLTYALERAGHRAVEAANGREGMGAFTRERFDLVITDIIMPDQEGIETILQMRRAAAEVPVLAISGAIPSEGMDYLAMAKELGATEVMAKPFDMTDLLAAVERCLARAAPEPPKDG